MILYEHPRIHDTKLGNGVKIVAFGDLHFGARDCSEERFERMILQAYAADPNAYFLMMGDMLDAIVTSDQKRYTARCASPEMVTMEESGWSKCSAWSSPLEARTDRMACRYGSARGR